MFPISRKKLGIKKILFPADQKLVFTTRNEEKTASIGSSWLVSEKMEENRFY